jgi:predicted transcriptional regulator
MKTAISLPDDVFQQADRLARKLRVSRSALYRDALAEYLLRHQPEELTAAMDRALEQAGEGSDGFASEVSRRLLDAVEW